MNWMVFDKRYLVVLPQQQEETTHEEAGPRKKKKLLKYPSDIEDTNSCFRK